jgi:hypothetical protein
LNVGIVRVPDNEHYREGLPLLHDVVYKRPCVLFAREYSCGICQMIGGLLIVVFSTAYAQAPAPAPLQTPNPHYTSIPLEIAINRPAAEVWKRVGKYCDLEEWLQVDCVITSGKDGAVGAVRSLRNGAVIEILVAKTSMSYTYTQPVREGLRYNLYHGTVEAVPVSASTSKLL